MNLKELTSEYNKAYHRRDFKKTVEVCDEVLKEDPNDQIAMGFKSMSPICLKQYDVALELLNEATQRYPENYHFKNLLAMAYFDLGDYEKSIQYCDEGLAIDEDYFWILDNKTKALIMLDRIDEAKKVCEHRYAEPFEEMILQTGDYRRALDYFLDKNDCYEINELKWYIHNHDREAISQIGDYYMNWIHMIKSKSNVKVCRDCGGELIEIVYGNHHPITIKRAENGEIHLGGDTPLDVNYHCRKCGHEFNLGYEGFEIECEDPKLYHYIKYQIGKFNFELKYDSKTLESLKETLKYSLYGDEFDAFINKLIAVGHISVDGEGYVSIIA